MVNPTQINDPFKQVLGGSIKSLSFTDKHPQYGTVPKPVGTAYQGVVCEEVDAQQAREYNPDGIGDLKFYDEAKTQPIMQAVITIQTDLREDEGDDGKRRIYGKVPIQKALKEEMQALKITEFGIGTKLAIRSTGVRPNPKGGMPSQDYEIKLWDITPRGTSPFAAVAAQGGEQWAPEAPAPTQGFPPAQQAQAAPQQQFVQPAQPAFPGQMVPQQQAPAFPPQQAAPAPQQGFAPPPPPAGGFAAPVAPNAFEQQVAAPAAPVLQEVPVTQVQVDQVVSLVQSAGYDLNAAIDAVAQFALQQAGASDPTFAQRLQQSIPF